MSSCITCISLLLPARPVQRQTTLVQQLFLWFFLLSLFPQFDLFFFYCILYFFWEFKLNQLAVILSYFLVSRQVLYLPPFTLLTWHSYSVNSQRLAALSLLQPILFSKFTRRKLIRSTELEDVKKPQPCPLGGENRCIPQRMRSEANTINIPKFLIL